jgi:ethanolamine utilization protein EutN
MIYSKVVGTVWATERVPTIQQASLKLVAPCQPGTGITYGPAIIAVDLVGCRKDDQVLVVYEGSSTRFALGDKNSPCEAIVVGIVDRLDIEET